MAELREIKVRYYTVGGWGVVHRHREHELMLIHEGSGELVMDGEASPVGPGTLCLVPANTEHCFSMRGTEAFVRTVVHFPVEILEANVMGTIIGDAMEGLLGGPPVAIDGTGMRGIESRVAMIQGLLDRTDPLGVLHRNVAFIELACFAGLLLSEGKGGSREPNIEGIDDPLVKSAVNLMNYYPVDHWNSGGLAAHLCVSPTTLCHRFRRSMGMPVTRYLMNRRVHEAARLLLEGSLPISTVFRRVGYRNASYFTRLFTSIMGVTPSEYRAKGGKDRIGANHR